MDSSSPNLFLRFYFFFAPCDSDCSGNLERLSKKNRFLGFGSLSEKRELQYIRKVEWTGFFARD
ncbi:hypothetical protein DLM78_14130 [Leptospira stimsonii]|uniref:Uncharacterized protein n=1 Tax=Leptospira stimsonii TaxID=2202203 RepID=A0A8B3CRM1_9LEPT|nr:hypothetical protein DLM78_14130 [Leptospira stimsonii]